MSLTDNLEMWLCDSWTTQYESEADRRVKMEEMLENVYGDTTSLESWAYFKLMDLIEVKSLVDAITNGNLDMDLLRKLIREWLADESCNVCNKYIDGEECPCEEEVEELDCEKCGNALHGGDNNKMGWSHRDYETLCDMCYDKEAEAEEQCNCCDATRPYKLLEAYKWSYCNNSECELWTCPECLNEELVCKTCQEK